MASALVTNGSANGLSAAQKLMQKHQEAYKPTVQDVPDEDLQPNPHSKSSSVVESVDEASTDPGWVSPLSANTAAKSKADSVAKNNTPLDTMSDELFPGLGGAPKSLSAPVWGVKTTATATSSTTDRYSNGSVTYGPSTPVSSTNTPYGTSHPVSRATPQSLAGQIQAPFLVFQSKDILPRGQLKKPIADTLKDINKKLRTNLTMTTGEGGVLEFRETSNQKEALKQQAIRDLGTQIGAKTSVKMSIPRAARAHIIGKQGSTIKALQEATGARIQMAKLEDKLAPADEEDDMIDVILEGNYAAIQLARKEIDKIATERAPRVNAKLRTIPAEFYPFISGSNDAAVNALEQTYGVEVHIPSHHIWTSQPPPAKPPAGQIPVFAPPTDDHHIAITGERAAVQAARADIEQLVQELRQKLTLEQFMVNNSQHQFIIGNQGVSPQYFFAKTGCAIILPGDVDEDSITVVGPAERIDTAMDYAMDLASSMNQAMFDVSRHYRNAPGGARAHARNITQYLRDRQEIERIGELHHIHIVTPMDAEGAAPWELFYRSENSKIATKAQNEIGSIIIAHPPARITTMSVDPFYYDYLRRDVTSRVQRDYGVHMVVPKPNASQDPVLLVFEGESGLSPDYQVSREKPDADEVRAFQRGLEDARAHVMDILSKQAEIAETEIEVPRIFHEKLRRYIQKEQKDRATDQIPVRVFVSGTKLTLRGPAPAVKTLASKVTAFVSLATEDEKERGFTLSFSFPQKHANQLIGKGGSNIRELRERFDVEINVNDGMVELKGPKAKADAAKAHITSLSKNWADETTYVLKIDPIHHRELIGAQGAQINRLQTRYKCQIYFPRSAKASKDDQSNADAASEADRRGPRREQEPDEVIVKGPKKGADEARDEILSLVQYLKDHSHTAVVAVQAGQIPSLIGQRGMAMEEIRQTTSAKIDIPNTKDIQDPSTRVEIQIKGTKSAVSQAKKLIEEKKHIFDQTITRTLDIDKKHHRALIGTQGSVIRDIIIKAGGSNDRHDLARTVQFPKADAEGNSIKIEGRSDVVEKIIESMSRIVLERESQTTEAVNVPTEMHRSLIGRGGETKKDLEARFTVSIDIPRQGTGISEIKVTGLPVNVEKARAHILDLVKEHQGETIQVPRSLHHVVADNGQLFRRLRNDHQVTVDHGGQKVPTKPPTPTNVRSNFTTLPLITDEEDPTQDAYIFSTVDTSGSNDDGEIPWILRGTPENIAKAKAILVAALEHALKSTTTGYLVLPDPRNYRYVIGQGGSKVNSIRKATGCKISVPRDQAPDEAIEIVGSAERVEKARELVIKAVKDGITASRDGHIRNSYHHGNRGNGNGMGNSN